jgi:hypothetical protein
MWSTYLKSAVIWKKVKKKVADNYDLGKYMQYASKSTKKLRA